MNSKYRKCDGLGKQVAMLLFSSILSPRRSLMLQSLKERGFTITVIAWDRIGNTQMPAEYRDVVDTWLWINVSAPVWTPRIIFKLPLLYYHTLKLANNMKKPDMYILTHYFHLPLTFFLPGKKVYESAEMYSLDISFYFGRFQKFTYPIIKYIEGCMASRVDGILTVDSKDGWFKNYFMRWNANVQVIWNVPSIENKRSSATEGFSNKFRNRKVISFVGGLMKEKGLRIALDACAIARGKHPEVLLLFMGLMKDRLTDIKGMIESKGIEDNVSFLPHLPYEEMLSYLRIAKAGLALYQPTYHYRELSSGNARKIFTYMQAGIPTIGPDFDEIGSVVKEEQCGILVDTTSPQEVAEAIIYLLDNAEHASAMGERGRKSILEKYNWEIEKKKFLSFIGRLDTTADCS